MCQSMVNIQSPTAEIRRGKKSRRKKKKETGWKYIWSALLHRATIKKSSAVAEMGDRGDNRYGPKSAVSLLGGDGWISV